MTSSTPPEHEIAEAHQALYHGMIVRDTALLDDLLDDDYTLTHMTGYVQPKREWLRDIDSGRMRYHSARPHSITIEASGDTAVVVGQDLVDATIWGGRGTWQLQLTTTFERRDDAWIALFTVATTY